jgi:hypothetical protein
MGSPESMVTLHHLIHQSYTKVQGIHNCTGVFLFLFIFYMLSHVLVMRLREFIELQILFWKRRAEKRKMVNKILLALEQTKS